MAVAVYSRMTSPYDLAMAPGDINPVPVAGYMSGHFYVNVTTGTGATVTLTDYEMMPSFPGINGVYDLTLSIQVGAVQTPSGLFCHAYVDPFDTRTSAYYGISTTTTPLSLTVVVADPTNALVTSACNTVDYTFDVATYSIETSRVTSRLLLQQGNPMYLHITTLDATTGATLQYRVTYTLTPTLRD
jgi:hypothetical protein